MEASTEKKIKSVLEFIPVALFALNMVLYIAYCASCFYERVILSDSAYLIIQQFIEGSFVLLLILHLVRLLHRWRAMPTICLWGLTALWFNNLPYIVFEWHIGVYFAIFSTIIYTIVLIFVFRILTNR